MMRRLLLLAYTKVTPSEIFHCRGAEGPMSGFHFVSDTFPTASLFRPSAPAESRSSVSACLPCGFLGLQ